MVLDFYRKGAEAQSFCGVNLLVFVESTFL
jgi:hypothetical protein